MVKSLSKHSQGPSGACVSMRELKTMKDENNQSPREGDKVPIPFKNAVRLWEREPRFGNTNKDVGTRTKSPHLQENVFKCIVDG